jgi:hypothetical protein
LRAYFGDIVWENEVMNLETQRRGGRAAWWDMRDGIADWAFGSYAPVISALHGNNCTLIGSNPIAPSPRI